jgi:DNA-directed RNA polymerase subunit RPC12/RpoP
MRCPECNSKKYRKEYGLGFYRYTCYCCGYESATVYVGLSDDDRSMLNEIDSDAQEDEDYDDDETECPNCGSTELEVIKETDDTIIYQCCQCGRGFEVAKDDDDDDWDDDDDDDWDDDDDDDWDDDDDDWDDDDDDWDDDDDDDDDDNDY